MFSNSGFTCDSPSLCASARQHYWDSLLTLYSPQLTSDTYIIQLWCAGYIDCTRIGGVDGISQKHDRGRPAARRNKMWRSWGPHLAPAVIGKVSVLSFRDLLCLPSDYRPFSSQPSQAWHRLTQTPYSRTERSFHARTQLEDPPQPPTPAAIGLDLVPTPHSGERQIEIEFDNPQLIHQLFQVFTYRRECGGAMAVLEAEGSDGDNGNSRLHANDRISRAKISG
ncbi:hypothetical protein BGW80DRAFT_1248682 [Lactifluus volemus]|nr:hypothetical protein BGW80DRAFT_1248682 [Lactifluus volemus]